MQSGVRDRNSEEGDIDFGHFLGIIKENRWSIFRWTIFFLAIGLAYVVFGIRIYEADALVQVEPESSGLSGLSLLTQALTDSDSQTVTEIDIIQSRKVLGTAVDEENLTIDVEALNWFGLPFLSSNQDTDVSVSSMAVPEDVETEDVDLYVGEKGAYTVKYDRTNLGMGYVGKPFSAMDGQFRLLIDRINAPAGSHFSITHYPRQMAIDKLYKDLDVEEQGKQSGVIQLSLTGQDKAKTVSIVQSVANAYLAQNVHMRAEEAVKSLDFLRDQLPKVKADLYRSEDALNAYRLQHGSLDMELEAKAVLEQGAMLQQQLSDLSVQQAQIGRKYSPLHPAYKTLLDERASVMNQIDALKHQAADMPDSQQKLLRLTRDVEVNEQLYLEMSESVLELDVERAGTVGNVRILDNSDAEWKPVRPKAIIVIPISIMFGMFFGVSLALLRKFMNPGVESVDELEYAGLPVLAVVPFSDEQSSAEGRLRSSLRFMGRKAALMGSRHPNLLLAAVKPEDTVVESLRGLRTSLHFSLQKAGNNIIMISGPSPHVGKSFVTANLGVVLAQGGQRVLVIDADMRRGSVHDYFGLPRNEGLSELLQEKLPKEVVIKTSTTPGLDVIGRGSAPANPAELLMAHNMTDLLEWAKGAYDIVLIDTPPVLAVTDASIVGRLAGITLIVCRHRINSVHEVQLTQRRFEQSGIEVDGYLLNGIKREAGYYGNNGRGFYSYEYHSVRNDET